MQEKYAGRVKGADFWNPELDTIIGGSGGIGSWTALALARMGMAERIHLFDDDMVEDHNLSGQFFSVSDIGKTKVEAVSDAIYRYTGSRINTYTRRLNDKSMAAPVMISAFDNMEARRDMYQVFASYDQRELFIDGRLELDTYFVYASQKHDKIWDDDPYVATLVSDDEMPDIECTAKQTTNIAMMIGGHIAQLVANYYVNKKMGVEVRRIPFKTSFHGSILKMETA